MPIKSGTKKRYDVAVIGGGPAGMMAAGTSAMFGASVILIEKNKIPGKKLLITGKGRCNITNADFDTGSFVNKFGKKGKFLYSALSSFSVEDTIRFFNNIGLQTKTERGNRVFPVSDSSADVKKALIRYMNKYGVDVITGVKVEDINISGNCISDAMVNDSEINADNYIICTGGLSYPGTGSTGDGYRWCENTGHKIEEPLPALTDIIVNEKWVSRLKGLVLKNIEVNVYHENKKLDGRFGEASFTNRGMDGPVILDMSSNIKSLLDKEVQLHIDLKPALDHKKLDARIQRDFKEIQNRDFRNSLDKLFPRQLIPVMIELSGIDPFKKVNSVTREERKGLVNITKNLLLNVKGTGDFQRAIITGVV